MNLQNTSLKRYIIVNHKERRDLMNCLFCRDNGKIGGCPECGKEYVLLGNDKTKLSTSVAKNLGIPKHYLKEKWNSLILRQYYNQFIDDADFDNYVNQLDTCIKILREGKLPQMSALVTAPIGYGKTTWAYNCIIEASSHNYSTVPLVDTGQLRRMFLTASENPGWVNKFAGYNYNEYLYADLLIACVSDGPEFIYAYETIVNVVTIRSRLEKPTIFISNYGVNELMKEDRRKQLYKLLNGGLNVDPYRYLVHIGFTEYERG